MDERSARIDARFRGPLLVAALLTLPATIIQVSHPGRTLGIIAAVLNWAIWGMFLLEVVVMLAVVPSRARWARHHLLDIAIVVLTPPVFLTAIQPIRLLRLARLLRLLRLAPLFRFLTSEEGLRSVGLLALLTAVAGGAGFAEVEGRSIGTGFYWSIQTMTTVGYGDVTPHTTAGRILAIVVMLIGIGTVTLVVGAIAQRIVTTTVEEELSAVAQDEDEALIDQVREVASALEQVQSVLERRRRGS